MQCDVDELQFFLAKKDGAWLPSNDRDAVSVRSGAIPDQLKKVMNGEIDPAEAIDDLFGGSPTTKVIHVLVVVPCSINRGTMEEPIEWAGIWRELKRLCSSAGQDWSYQGASEFVTELKKPLAQHYNTWQQGYEDKQNHAINLVMSGPGTGKSRMLDEMKGLLCEAAKQSKKQDLTERMENAYVIRVTFEIGTSATGKQLDSLGFDVSYRMLYRHRQKDATT